MRTPTAASAALKETSPHDLEAPVVAAPRTIRLLRDGLVWHCGSEWPSPPGLRKLPYHVTDIFYDAEDKEYVVFGSPLKGSEEQKKGACVRARVPLDLGAAISESLLPISEAILEVKNHLAESENEWAARWEEDDAEDEPPSEGESKSEEDGAS